MNYTIDSTVYNSQFISDCVMKMMLALKSDNDFTVEEKSRLASAISSLDPTVSPTQLDAQEEERYQKSLIDGMRLFEQTLDIERLKSMVNDKSYARMYIADENHTISGPYQDQKGTYYLLSGPISFVWLPLINEKTRETTLLDSYAIQIPATYRTVYCEKYDDAAKEKLVDQMTEFFKNFNGWLKFCPYRSLDSQKA